MSNPTHEPSEPIVVTAQDADMLRFLFGEHASEMAEVLAKPRELQRYVQAEEKSPEEPT